MKKMILATGLSLLATAAFADTTFDHNTNAKSNGSTIGQLSSQWKHNGDVVAGKQVAVMCFKTGERTSGMNKICYYDCLGSAAAITIGAVELCPLSIND
ncbi:hypothetical protein [Rhizobium sp. RAF56]|uniref:hypothetical protein n=1 Tax=Rhizobium sp. RAF56 TaxID=3233062 RepID=UPI003F9BCA5E